MQKKWAVDARSAFDNAGERATAHAQNGFHSPMGKDGNAQKATSGIVDIGLEQVVTQNCILTFVRPVFLVTVRIFLQFVFTSARIFIVFFCFFLTIAVFNGLHFHLCKRANRRLKKKKMFEPA